MKKVVHDKFNTKYFIARGLFINRVLQDIKQLVIKEGGSIEWGRLTFAFAAAAKKYGGITQMLWELEAEGSIVVDILPTAKGFMKTVNLNQQIRKAIK